ncbi:MAG: molybdopterin oxidoreductase [Firmicutes bacterium HGW-Firmicutes-1]|jgi:CxxC motif-containing protein|nr:MAG: molybdopterin oxidoreductase [Firmicutes bacterium HGW-Firmicutes-1]
MSVKSLTCIACPVGCQLEVTIKGDDITVTGNACNRGPEYAVNELTNPTRVLTTTVAVKDGFLNRLPVNTNIEIPKGLLFEAMEIINKTMVQAPVKVRDVIIKDILGTGADVLASRSMSKK